MQNDKNIHGNQAKQVCLFIFRKSAQIWRRRSAPWNDSLQRNQWHKKYIRSKLGYKWYKQSYWEPVGLYVIHFIEFFASFWRLFPRNQHRSVLEWRLLAHHRSHWFVRASNLATRNTKADYFKSQPEQNIHYSCRNSLLTSKINFLKSRPTIVF